MLMTPEVKTDEVRKRRDRPFPWPCANCLKDEVYPVTMPYTTEVKHDGRTYKLTIPALTIPKCRSCGELVFSNSVDDQIIAALRAEARLLTPEQIKAGRKALGLKSKELAQRLGVATATVSRWEKKMMIQSRAMDNLLRVFFAVPEARAVLRGPEQDAALGLPPVSPEVPPMGTKIDEVEEVARWLHLAAHEAGQVELVRKLIRDAVNVVGDIWDPPEGGNEPDDPEDPRTVIGGRFAAAWDECDREARADG